MRQSLLIFFVSLSALFCACESDYSYRGDGTSIAFSTDTLSFDSVFTGIATTTAKLMIYNRSGKDMTLDQIYLKNGNTSSFNVNINGSNTTSLSNLHLRSGDSLYVFVNVFPKETDGKTYQLDDDIIVIGGSNTWSAHLLAYGMNVRRISGHLSTDTSFDNGLPYLISDTLTIDANVTLSVAHGATIYMNENAAIEVYGTLNCEGSLDNRIVFRASRTDKFYNDIPGQWHAISIMQPCGKASIRYTEIANSSYGIQADSATMVTLDCVVIRDAMHNAIRSYAANTTITNSLLYNCGDALLDIYGGNVALLHCTMSNYFKWDSRFDASIMAHAGEKYPALERLSIINSVVVGNTANELDLDDTFTADNTLISHCYMRLGSKWKENDDPRIEAVIVGKEPGFVNRDSCDFHLTVDSPLRDAADISHSQQLSTDYDGISRCHGNTSDIGAYTFTPLTTDDNE